MQKVQIESYSLVAVQFLCAGILIYDVLSLPLTVLPITMITAAIAIALWSVFTMRIGNIRIQPIPKTDAQLISSGPYRFARHPMYAAVLLAMLGLAITINSIFGYSVWIVLCIDLLLKLRFEEKLLMVRFPEYREYMDRTKKLLPFLW